jgi:hypothetical protein
MKVLVNYLQVDSCYDDVLLMSGWYKDLGVTGFYAGTFPRPNSVTDTRGLKIHAIL